MSASTSGCASFVTMVQSADFRECDHITCCGGLWLSRQVGPTRTLRASVATPGPRRSKTAGLVAAASDGLASQRVELLPERKVLEDEFVPSVAGQCQRADEYQNHLRHASILSFYQQRSNNPPSGFDCGEGQDRASILTRAPHTLCRYSCDFSRLCCSTD